MITSSYPDPEKLFAWARYLYWADLLFRRYSEAAESFTAETQDGVPTDWPEWWKVFAATSQWYAAEYVVVEGWRDLKASDSVIDQILGDYPTYVDQLRRYRNAVFHFRPSLSEQRFRDFLAASMQTVPWIRHLHEELLRYYWQFVENLPGSSPEQRTELRGAALTAVGWVPSDIFPARLRAAELLAEKANSVTAGDDSPAARELRAAAQHAIDLARKGLQDYGRNLASLYKASQ